MNIRYFKDAINVKDEYKKNNGIYIPKTGIDSKIEFFNETGERIWEPLHNKTTIAGAGLIAMKLFGLDRNVLDNTPTYDTTLGLLDGSDGTTYPTVAIKDADNNTVGSIGDETQRVICGFCVGQGGAGIDASDVFDVEYDSWITPDNLVPFRYPLVSADIVDENIYKGKKNITLANGQNRDAYYFKSFSNSPNLVQNYTSTIGSFSDSISPNTVYNKITDSKAQSYVEIHLKITKDDCREFFMAHKGLENAKINQLSLVSAWSKTIDVSKIDGKGNKVTKKIEYLQDIRPFSLLNIPNEIISDLSKSISVIYTLYF